MTEGILTMYSGNTFTIFVTRAKKKWIHASLQATGGALGLAGYFIEIYNQMECDEPFFDKWHAIFGRCGV
jgi:hypothetical protein